ncbi:MAG: peptide chain release factor 1 [Candidatus Margulisiibacteriota bacterium]
MFLEKLSSIENRYKELETKLADPNIINDRELFQKYSKEFSDLQYLVAMIVDYKNTINEIKDTRTLLDDSDMKEMARAELDKLEQKELRLKNDIEFELLPKDPNDDKNIIVEVRAGTGGEEAALFAGELLRMYLRYAERHGLKTEMIDSNPTGLGGYKEAIFNIIGKGAYSKLKYESGTHRVQRVPATETSGRIHTSAATVAVMPEAEEVDLRIEDKDLRIDTFRASGAGGQHVNKTSSAVRITHIPSGFAVACQSERSQHQNKAKAMKLLRARIYEMKEEELRKDREQTRKIMVGSGDRSEKIRTYNFPQGRVTDHRIGFTIYKLNEVMDGDLDEIIKALSEADRIAKLEKIK